jgi:hypothetical protein
MITIRNLYHKVRNRSLTFSSWTWIATLLLVMSYILFSDRENIFTIVGKTESLSIAFSDNQVNQWNISGASYVDGIENLEPQKLDSAEAFFVPSAGTQANISITEYNDKTHLLVSLSSEKGSVGSIESGIQTIKLGDYAEVNLPITARIVLPFEGSSRIGEDVTVGVENILLNGVIKIVEQQFFEGGRYVAGEYNLDQGDRIELFEDSSLNKLSKIKGFLRLTPGNPVELTAHGVGEVLKVHRLGSAGYELTPSLWSRVTSDPAISALTTFFATYIIQPL